MRRLSSHGDLKSHVLLQLFLASVKGGEFCCEDCRHGLQETHHKVVGIASCDDVVHLVVHLGGVKFSNRQKEITKDDQKVQSINAKSSS